MSLNLQQIIKNLDKKSNLKSMIDTFEQKPFKIFYRGLLPKIVRSGLKFHANIQQQNMLAQNFRALITFYHQGQLPQFHIKPKQVFNHQKIIWQYWGQGTSSDLPEIVKLSFASIDKYKGDYQVIRLDDNSLHDYLEFPDFIWEKRKNPEFKHAFFADLLRLALLNAYGGIWADATILLTAPIDDNIKLQDFFMFQRSDTAADKEFWQAFNGDYFSWQKIHHVNVLNSFIVAKKENVVICHCLNLLLNYWHTQKHITHYFFFQIMFDVLIKEFIPEHNCPIIDDTLPHLLQTKLSKTFNQLEYNDIISKINIHKMSYVQEIPPNSYYEHLKKQF